MRERLTAIFFVFMAVAAYAGGPKWRYQDPKLNDEISNIYHDINATLDGRIESIDADMVTISTITVSSATITNLRVTNISGVSLGKVLQVVKSSSTTSFSTASTSFVASNLTATITPLNANSTILVMAYGTLENSSGNNNAYATILRGSTNLAGADGIAIAGTNVAAQFRAPLGMGIYDAPNTTNATTYSVAVRGSAGTTYFGDSANNTQIMILMEVAP